MSCPCGKHGLPGEETKMQIPIQLAVISRNKVIIDVLDYGDSLDGYDLTNRFAQVSLINQITEALNRAEFLDEENNGTSN